MYSRRTAFKENRTFLNKMYEKKRLVRKKWMAAASDVRRTIYILHKEEHMKTWTTCPLKTWYNEHTVACLEGDTHLLYDIVRSHVVAIAPVY